MQPIASLQNTSGAQLDIFLGNTYMEEEEIMQ